MKTTITGKPLLLSTLLLMFLALAACGGGGGGGDDLIYLDENNNPRDLDDVLEEREDDSGGEIIDDTPTLDDVVVTSGNVTATAPGRSLLETIDLTVSTTTLSATLPQGLSQVGSAVEVAVSDAHQELLNGPITIAVTYNQGEVQNESNLLALYYDGTSFHPLTVLARDEQNNILTFDTRRFSTFVLAEADANPPASFATGFAPAVNGWDIANYGSYFSPGGNSFGMAGFAAWHFDQATLLSGAYLAEANRIAAARVQMSQSETWGVQQWRNTQAFKDEDLGLLLKAYLSAFNAPLVLTLGENSATTAAVVYAYDETGFYFYDPNIPGAEQFIGFDGTSFGAYGGLSVRGYAALASYGRDGDFAALAQEAAAGFPGSENLAVDTPQEGELINARESDFSGSFLNDLSTETSLYVEVRGVGRQLSVPSGTFSNAIEISHGINTIVALAGVDASTENNWFKSAPTVVREVEGTLPPAHLLVTLTWEQDETDVDLYITEPEGEAMWFGNRRTGNGLELDIDDTTGFGPEHGTLEIGSATEVLEGIYTVRVHYFSDDGLDVDATGRVTIIINEGLPEQSFLSLRFRIADDNSGESGPDGSGSSWVDIAKVDVVNNEISTDFSDEGEP